MKLQCNTDSENLLSVFEHCFRVTDKYMTLHGDCTKSNSFLLLREKTPTNEQKSSGPLFVHNNRFENNVEPQHSKPSCFLFVAVVIINGYLVSIMHGNGIERIFYLIWMVI